MSSRPAATPPAAGGHSLRAVLMAGMATEMNADKRARTDGGGPSAGPAAAADDDEEELYAVSIAIPRVAVPPATLPGHNVMPGTDEQPFVQPQVLPATADIEYRRFPLNYTDELDSVCAGAAAASLSEKGIYERLYMRVKQKMGQTAPPFINDISPAQVASIQQSSDTLESLLLMNNALSQSETQNAYIDFMPPQGVDGTPSLEQRTFGLCVQLRNLVEGLKNGHWNAAKGNANFNAYVRDLANTLDPRDLPPWSFGGAQAF